MTVAEWVEYQTNMVAKRDSIDSDYKPLTLEGYFKYCDEHFIIDHTIRYLSDTNRFYIHPAGFKGPTVDFQLSEYNWLKAIAN
jgi:hypothetical protein